MRATARDMRVAASLRELVLTHIHHCTDQGVGASPCLYLSLVWHLKLSMSPSAAARAQLAGLQVVAISSFQRAQAQTADCSI
jgi:hypothetical protein